MSITTPTPNAWCVILGKPGVDPLTIVGPFATVAEANAHASEHQNQDPLIPAVADVLINSANC